MREWMLKIEPALDFAGRRRRFIPSFPARRLGVILVHEMLEAFFVAIQILFHPAEFILK